MVDGRLMAVTVHAQLPVDQASSPVSTVVLALSQGMVGFPALAQLWRQGSALLLLVSVNIVSFFPVKILLFSKENRLI